MMWLYTDRSLWRLIRQSWSRRHLTLQQKRNTGCYTHNCDHAARIIAGTVDQELQKYTESAWRMTPNGNLKAFADRADDWDVMTLGKQRLPEKILLFFMVF